jgi:DNA-binding FrmR family transcriptional regulator
MNVNMDACKDRDRDLREVEGGVREPPEHVDSYKQDKERILARLRRMEGQVRGLQRMVEEDRYCVDILTQISSRIAASRSIGLVLLEDHIRGCVINAEDREAAVQEVIEAIERFSRSVG